MERQAAKLLKPTITIVQTDEHYEIETKALVTFKNVYTIGEEFEMTLSGKGDKGKVCYFNVPISIGTFG